MKRASISFEATGVQPVERNANGVNAVFDRHLLMIGLWVFTGYYLGCKIGFALTFQPHPVSVLWPPIFVLVFRCRVRGVESLGARRVLGVDPYAVIFKCRLSANHRAVDRNMGHEGSSVPENSITFALLGSLRRLSRLVGGQLRCPL